MKPYQPGESIFQTSADTRFNSFSGPSAMAYNQQNGQWGVDPNLMTPAYTAAYRPTQNVNQGNPFGGPRPGFGQSANQVFNPFAGGGTNYGGNTYQQQSPFYDTLGYNPLDHAASIAQKYAVPGFASWLSYRFLAKPLGELGSRVAAGAATGIVGGAMSAGATATVGSIAGGLGRFAGSIGGPMAIAQAAVWGADKALFDPYIAQRQTTNDLRRNFAGVTMGSGMGNAITGKGFSREAAGHIAGQINVMGAQDFSFNQSEVSKLTDLSARSGLLDTVQGGQLAEKMRAITKQVKMVMQIGNTSDFKEAIEVLSKLQTSGVGTKDVTSVLTKLGGMASVAGVSLQKMMSTVGAQGEYQFAANGLNPFAGQLTAANAYGAFSAAQRTGLMSQALLARMGGVEGATQSSTTALLNMAQSPYAGMREYNKVLGGGGGGGVVGNVSRFGGAMARGGLGAIGEFEYNRAELASKSLEQGGQQGQMDQLLEMGKSGAIPGLMKNGKIDAYAAYPVLQQVFGLKPEEAKAFIERQRSAQDPETIRMSKQALQNAWQETKIKAAEQEGYGSIFSPMTRPVHLLFNSVQEGTTRSIAHGMRSVDSAVDSLEKTFMGKIAENTGNPFDELDKPPTPQLNLDFNPDNLPGAKGGLVDRLNADTDAGTLKDAAKDLKNNKDVIDAVVKKDRSGLLLAIGNAVGNELGEKDFADAGMQGKLADFLLAQGTAPIKTDQTTLQQMTGAGSKDDAKKLVDLGISISQRNGKVTTEDLDTYNRLMPKDKAANVVELKTKMDLIAKNINMPGKSGLKGSAAEFTTDWQTTERAKTLQKQSADLDKAGGMDFSKMNLSMSAIAGAIDPNTGAMKVINVDAKKVENMAALNNPGYHYEKGMFGMSEVKDMSK